MDEQQFDKRMALLKKSYDRIEPQLDPVDVVVQIEAEEVASTKEIVSLPQKNPNKWKKPTVWVASIASVLIVGVLATSYIIGPPTTVQTTEIEQSINYDEWLVDFTKKYEEKREEMRIELDMPEEEFNKLSTVQMASSSLNHLKSRKAEFLESQIINDDFTQSMEWSVMNYLMTPSEIFKIWEDSSVSKHLPFSDSFDYFKLYANTANEIASYYTSRLTDYSKILTTDSNHFPKELKHLISTANKQYIELQSDGQFRPNPLFGEHASSYKDNIHPDIVGYFKHLATGSLLVGGDLRLTASETAAILVMYEQTLLADSFTDSLEYMVLKGEYENTWLALLKGTESFSTHTLDGQITEEYKAFIMRVAEGEFGMVMQETAQTIVNELKTGKSLTLFQLTAYDVWMGVLKKRYNPETNTQYGATEVALDEYSIQLAQQIYNTYKQTGDMTVLNSLQPLNVVSLYIYALSQQDYKVAQQLVMDEVVGTEIPKFSDMLIFSDLSETKGATITIKATVKEEEQRIFGQSILFRIDTMTNDLGESQFRIAAIN